MEFNLKFFIVATVLTVAQTLVNITVWIRYIGLSDFQTSMYFLFQPLQLVLSVFLPFAVMYTISLKTPQETRLRSILVSIFFGCWLGGLVNTAIQFFVTMQSSSWASVNPLLTIYELAWFITVAAFSDILFVSIAAIMLAYYRAHRKIANV